ncbi:MAG: methylglyoxal synthase [Treponemataceae bacterium]
MEKHKRIALVAHDNRKKDLVEWVEYNWQTLVKHHLVCTGTTGRLVEEAIISKRLSAGEHVTIEKAAKDLDIRKLKSGPLGGDQQLGALIAESLIDIVVFFWDPMAPQPHDVDVKALLRIAAVYNVTIATTRATADFIISSPLMTQEYEPLLKDYSAYTQRVL